MYRAKFEAGKRILTGFLRFREASSRESHGGSEWKEKLAEKAPQFIRGPGQGGFWEGETKTEKKLLTDIEALFSPQCLQSRRQKTCREEIGSDEY